MTLKTGTYSLEGKRVWVAGHTGMVGSALFRRLERENCEILTVSRSELDLRIPSAVDSWMAAHRPQAVFMAAATVGGILANKNYPADFLYNNLMVEASVIESSRRYSVEKLLFLGSSCIYPRLAVQPIVEEALLTGPLEPTNQWYAIAKITGVKLVQAYRLQYGCDFISAMPTNLYGQGDNFDLNSSHVMPALLRKAHEARIENASILEVWGSGTPRREFLHVDDCADACIFLMKNYSQEDHINVGLGEDISIGELAKLICEIVEFKGDLVFNSSKPDGPPRKFMSSARINALGWTPSIALREGVAATYQFLLSGAGIKERIRA